MARKTKTPAKARKAPPRTYQVILHKSGTTTVTLDPQKRRAIRRVRKAVREGRAAGREIRGEVKIQNNVTEKLTLIYQCYIDRKGQLRAEEL